MKPSRDPLWAPIPPTSAQASGSHLKNLLAHLSKNQLFETLTRRELAYVAQFVFERRYDAGEFVFHHGQRGFGMYLVISGCVQIKTETRLGEQWISSIPAGSFFGELALVETHNVRTASAVTTEPSILVGFFKPDLMDLLERKPSVGVKILLALTRVIGQRLTDSTALIHSLSHGGAPSAPSNPLGPGAAKGEL